MAPNDCGSSDGQLFSTATTGCGWAAVIVVILYGLYTGWRITCCCARRKRPAADSDLPQASQRCGACDVPLHAHPFLALLGSFRAARGAPDEGALRVGDAVRVHCYQHAAGWTASSVLLRLGAVPLDPPAPAGAWTASLGGRLHAGVFRIAAAQGGSFALVSATDATRALHRADPLAPGGWSGDFDASLLERAAARDAPMLARGFAGRPMRRVAAALLLEGLGAFAAATVEVSVASAAWQHACRPWWARVLTRSLSAAILLAGAEYCFTVIWPVAVERLPRYVATRGGAALALPLIGFAIWSLCVNGAAGGGALGSAFVVWLWALAISHVIIWPLLLLLSAAVWRDLAALPEELWEGGAPRASAPGPVEATAAPRQQPPPRASKPGRFGRGARDGCVAMESVAVAPPPPLPPPQSDNPFAGPAASAWQPPPTQRSQYGAW